MMDDSATLSAAGKCKWCETAQQELHEAKRGYHTALDVQRHLAAELDAAQTEHARVVSSHNAELTASKESLTAARQERDLLTTQLDTVQEELTKLRQKVKDLEREAARRDTPPPSPKAPSPSPVKAAVVDIAQIEEVRAEAQIEVSHWRAMVSELEERLTVANELNESRRAALAAATEREEELQAAATLLRAQLQTKDVQQDQEYHAAKGNSLFAEVDDKRQEMAHTLIMMKQKNQQLKRELGSVQAELEALLLEKRTVWDHYAAEASYHDQELIESYMERISTLEGLIEQQRREAARGSGTRGEPWAAVTASRTARVDKLTAALVASSAAELSRSTQVRELRRQLAAANAARHVSAS